jgi:hemerythrin-like domain-containing protein
VSPPVCGGDARRRRRDAQTLPVITAQLRRLCDFYPVHIAKEDKRFFAAARAYFTDEEDQAMPARFREFDRAMIHEKYRVVVEGRENE